MSYSQGGEEPAILDIFKDQDEGKFLDLGAYDGKTFSNTLALAERGWGGMCVDASPQAFVKLQETHRERTNIRLLCAAISTIAVPMARFYDTADLVSSLDEEHMQKWKDGNDVPFTEIWVPVITIEDIALCVGSEWDFVNIDIEGASLHVFYQMMEKTEIRPTAVCIEHDGNHIECSNRGRDWDYTPCFLDGNNIILRKN